ncbi:MAG: hypothetical protein JW702_11050 [Clostridiales bacterium]|nr:hypothetical protein [Clostridiales bacterium]
MGKPQKLRGILILTIIMTFCFAPMILTAQASTEEPVEEDQNSSFEASYLESWDTQLIDQWGFAGSIAFDSNNSPHVCYIVSSFLEQTTRTGLHYGVWNGTNWCTQTVDPNGSQGVIVVDSNDNPHILYYESPGNLKHAFWNGSNWIINFVDSSGWCGRYFDITMDSSGNPHIVYFQREKLELTYGVWDGFDWVITVVGAPLTVGDNLTPSIVLDLNDRPRIIYVEPVQYEIEKLNSSNKEMHLDHEVKYAAWNGSDWLLQTVGHNVSSTVGSLGNLVLDSKENPHISYVSKVTTYDSESGSFQTKFLLNYAYWNNSSWCAYPFDFEPVSDNKRSYISLDNNDKPSIYYFKEDNDSSLTYMKFWLFNVKWTGSDWNVETLDSNLTQVDTIVKDSQGKLHLLFDEPMGTIHGAWQYGRLTYATLIEKTTNDSLTTLIVIPVAIALIVCLALLIYYKKIKK